MGFERRNRVEPEEVFLRVMHQLAQGLTLGKRLVRLHLLAQSQHEEAVTRVLQTRVQGGI